MEIDRGMDLSTIRMETVKIKEVFLVLHRLKGETSHKIFHTVGQEVINLSILLAEDLKVVLQLVLHLTNKNSHKTITKRHLMWLASPEPTKPFMK